MIVKMLKTQTGSMDGVTVSKYLKGQEYSLSDDLAYVFIKQLEVAEEVEVTDIEIPGLDEVTDIEIPEKLVQIEKPEKSVQIEKPGKKTIKGKR